VSEPDPAIAAELVKVSAAVVTALTKVQNAAGPVIASQACLAMITLATQHLLAGCGPVAAKNALIVTYANLLAEIEAQNCGSAALS
jgi:hypothetical protein